MNLSISDYRKKVLGCWMGKNIGGTLGMPFEWKRQVNNISFYAQNFGGEPLPNDDLDIQLLWLVALEEKGLDLNANTLAEYWCTYVTPHWAEYGTGKINMRAGLLPPMSGTHENDFKHSCGSFIRSEIWACIAPGVPSVATQFAYNDAILDHGDGEGTHAEIFIAALESAAFVIKDFSKLVEIGLSYIPSDCEIWKAVKTAQEAFASGMDWKDARDKILERHRGSTFMNWGNINEEDRNKGFGEGKLGFDAPSNIGLTIIGLLYGGQDFGKVLTTTVNCGEDTDCTAATAGSIFGIMHGIDAIPQKWIDPIGRKIKTACLNLGELGIVNGLLPQDVDNLTDRTEKIALQFFMRNPHRGMEISDKATDLSDLVADRLKYYAGPIPLHSGLGGNRFAFDFFTIDVDYGSDPRVKANEPKKIRLIIHNTYKIQANLAVHWYTPAGWKVSPSPDACTLSFPHGLRPASVMEFSVLTEIVDRPMNRCAVEFTIAGRPTVMLVPIILLNGNG